jgi:putative ABC transport system substrate-binding protein
VNRRALITLLGGAAAWPMAARAQQAVPIIGFLNSASHETTPADRLRAFHQGLSQSGFVDGRNVVIEYRWAGGRNDRLPALADDLVRRQVAVIAAFGPASLPAKAATSTIPVVFSTSNDPVGDGLVGSLNRPGGNVTGVTTLGIELGPKRLELLHEIAPSGTAIAALLDHSTFGFEPGMRNLKAAARAYGLELHILRASNDREIDQAFANLLDVRAGGLVIGAHAFYSARSERLAALALRNAVPAISAYREFAAAGGLMSYETNISDQYRTVGIYTGRILKGEKPADLPVQQATKVELIINLKTAKALGLDVPPMLLARADEVIE